MSVKIRVSDLTARGQMLLGGRPVSFEVTIEGPSMSATFGDLPLGSTFWDAFRALEEFVDEHLRGE